jgi:hypothetical protein
MLEKCYRDRLTSKKITVMEPNKEKTVQEQLNFGKFSLQKWL